MLKNIVLAGMNVTIQDSSVVSMEDLQYNFFVGQDDLGRNVHAFICLCVIAYVAQ